MSLEDTQTLEANTTAAEVAQTESTQDAAPPSEEDEDAAFVQGFNATQGKEAAAPAAEPEPAPEPAPEPTPEPEPEPEQQFTPAQLREMSELVKRLEQRDHKVFGSLGALKQQIDQLRATPQPSQAAVKLTADKFKRLSAEFPQMAALLSEDLNEALAGAMPADAPAAAPTQAPPAAQELEQKFEQRLTQVSQQAEQKILTIVHKDWPVVVQSPEFKAWKDKLPEDERNQLDNSWDAIFIADQITAFKDWKAQSAKTKQSNQQRLEAAVTPRGNPQKAPTPTEDDAFEEGFRSVRGKT